MWQLVQLQNNAAGKTAKKKIDGLTKWLNVGQVTVALKATRDQEGHDPLL